MLSAFRALCHGVSTLKFFSAYAQTGIQDASSPSILRISFSSTWKANLIDQTYYPFVKKFVAQRSWINFSMITRMAWQFFSTNTNKDQRDSPKTLLLNFWINWILYRVSRLSRTCTSYSFFLSKQIWMMLKINKGTLIWNSLNSKNSFAAWRENTGCQFAKKILTTPRQSTSKIQSMHFSRWCGRTAKRISQSQPRKTNKEGKRESRKSFLNSYHACKRKMTAIENN